MTEPQEFEQPKKPSSSPSAKENAGNNDDTVSPVPDELKSTKDNVGDALDPVLARKKQKLQGLSDWREAEENSSFDFDLNWIFQLNQAELPLTRKDMLHETGNQALVLTRSDLETLGCLDFIHVSGERMLIEPESLDPKDVFILYPHEVGDEEKDS